ncbi:Homeobox protein Hox-A2 [Manis javanica]|nr:Homeobox protein Hox-A2 [Manis javanica]
MGLWSDNSANGNSEFEFFSLTASVGRTGEEKRRMKRKRRTKRKENRRGRGRLDGKERAGHTSGQNSQKSALMESKCLAG